MLTYQKLKEEFEKKMEELRREEERRKFVSFDDIREKIIDFFDENIVKNYGYFKIAFTTYKGLDNNYIRVEFFPSLKDKNDYLVEDYETNCDDCDFHNSNYRYNRNNVAEGILYVIKNPKIRDYYLQYFFNYLVCKTFIEIRKKSHLFEKTGKKHLTDLEKIVKKNFDYLSFNDKAFFYSEIFSKQFIELFLLSKQKLPKEENLIVYKNLSDIFQFEEEKKGFYVCENILKIVMFGAGEKSLLYDEKEPFLQTGYIFSVVELKNNIPVINEYSLKCIEILMEDEGALVIGFLPAPILTKIETIKSESSIIPKIYWNMFFEKIKKFELKK
jgi:hypothetical protein